MSSIEFVCTLGLLLEYCELWCTGFYQWSVVVTIHWCCGALVKVITVVNSSDIGKSVMPSETYMLFEVS